MGEDLEYIVCINIAIADKKNDNSRLTILRIWRIFGIFHLNQTIHMITRIITPDRIII